MSIDVLRGIAILLMILSGLLPKTLPNWFDHGYQPHYKPDAAGVWQAVPGIEAGKATFDPNWAAFTWVDLVFPMFLFAMGASIPVALSQRLARPGGTRWRAAKSILSRWAMLMLFAAMVVYLSTSHVKSTNDDTSRLRVVGAFLIASLFFVRMPDAVPRTVVTAIRTVAFVALATRILGAGVREGMPFSWSKADIIIRVLANTYLVAALAWLLVPRRGWARLLLLLPVMAAAHAAQYLGHLPAGADATGYAWANQLLNPSIDAFRSLASAADRTLNLPTWVPGLGYAAHNNAWIAELFNFSSLWSFSWLKYLWVVVPATLAGDWVMTWSQRQTIESGQMAGERSRASAWTLPLTLAVCVGVFVGLRHYGYGLWGVNGPLRTPFLALLLAIPPLVLLAFDVAPRAFGHLWISRRLLKSGLFFTVAGLALAAVPISGDGDFFEHGISKGPPASLSYYLLCVGLCQLLLMALVECLDYRRGRPAVPSRPGLFEANGMNALLAYYVSHTLAPAVLNLSIVSLFTDISASTPSTAAATQAGQAIVEIHSIDQLMRLKLLTGMWGQTLWAILITLGIALFVLLCTRLRVFWRA